MPRRFPRLALAATLAATLAVPTTATASSSQFTLFEAPRELSSPDPALRASTLDEIQGLGAKWIRVVLYWNNVAPASDQKSPPAGLDERNHAAGYDWTTYDRIINEASARGMKVLVTLSGPVPTWATARRSGHTYKPSRTRFERFAFAAGSRYGAQVTHWSIWNEPNHPQFLEPQYRKRRPYSPGLYRGLYVAGRKGLHASGNRSDTILAGETAPRGTPRVVAPIDFVEGFFTRRSPKVDGWAHHPYTTRSGPFFVPRDRDDVTIGVLSRLTRSLQRESGRRLSVYLTEFGVQSEPDPYVGVSEAKQAEYRSIAERIAYRNPRVRAFSQYMMRDDLPRAGSQYARYSGFESGLRHSDGSTKLSYDAFRLPLVAERSGNRVTLWGLVRPANGVAGVIIEYVDKRNWTRLKADGTDSRGYWSTTTRYKPGRTYRVTWTGFAGPATRVYRKP